jgi:glycosyltransferase involved in cell wall biosynthesis
MKIAQVAPLFESVPPKLYGGTERVVHYLTEELVAKGHEVTLFASGDSKTRARLISSTDQALRLNKSCFDPMAHQIVQMKDVLDNASAMDIIHFHTDYLHFPFTRLIGSPCITTLHGRLDIPDLQSVYNTFPEEQVVSISENQQIPLPQANWLGTVYHGLPLQLHTPGTGAGDYLAFLGRISPEKGIEQAIEIAINANMLLKVAAKVDKADETYFNDRVRHLLDHPLVEYIGEIDEPAKTIFLGAARALLFPINWEEPFGLVMIESMACGTPVLAFRHGSVSEIVEEGASGFIVNQVTEAVEALAQIPTLSRKRVRSIFEQRFTASRMADDYIRLYEQAKTSNVSANSAPHFPKYVFPENDLNIIS